MFRIFFSYVSGEQTVGINVGQTNIGNYYYLYNIMCVLPYSYKSEVLSRTTNERFSSVENGNL